MAKLPKHIPPHVQERILYAVEIVGDTCKDWIRVKKQILWILRPKDRSLFSRRHKTSKKHFINSFELLVMDLWENTTGVRLQIEQENLHRPEDERQPRSWGLMEYNRLRRERLGLPAKSPGKKKKNKKTKKKR